MVWLRFIQICPDSHDQPVLIRFTAVASSEWRVRNIHFAQVGWSIPSSWEANRCAQWSNPNMIDIYMISKAIQIKRFQ